MPCHPDRVRRHYQPKLPWDWTDLRLLSAAEAREREDEAWRRPSDTAAEQLERRGVTANVIEGDEH